MLTREKMLGALEPSELIKVEVLEWEDHVFVRKMRVRERDLFEALTFSTAQGNIVTAMDNYRAKFVVCTACNEEGELIFKPEDAEALGRKDVGPVNRIFTAARELNGLTIEEAEKNLGKIIDEDSSSS